MATPELETSVSLGVESASLLDAEISDFVGLAPTATSRWRSPSTQVEYTRWDVDLARGPVSWEVAQEAAQKLLTLGDGIATHLGELSTQKETSVTLSIVQRLSTDDRTTGLNFSSEVVAWLARAGAVIDIDQYVFGETDHDG